MSKGTPLRAVRIGDDLWHEAKVITERNGDTISDIVRSALAEYIRQNHS